MPIFSVKIWRFDWKIGTRELLAEKFGNAKGFKNCNLEKTYSELLKCYMDMIDSFCEKIKCVRGILLIRYSQLNVISGNVDYCKKMSNAADVHVKKATFYPWPWISLWAVTDESRKMIRYES